jgi:hypothetical protein
VPIVLGFILFGPIAGLASLLVFWRIPRVGAISRSSVREIMLAGSIAAAVAYLVADGCTRFSLSVDLLLTFVAAQLPAFVALVPAFLFARTRATLRGFRLTLVACLAALPIGPALLAMDARDLLDGDPSVADGPAQLLSLLLSPILTLCFVGWISLFVSIALVSVRSRSTVSEGMAAPPSRS